MKVLIATPAYNGQITTQYFDAVMGVLFQLQAMGVQVDHRFLTDSVISVSRNIFASLVLDQTDYTHLLFVDADMGFAPSLIEKMIRLNKPVVGGLCPQRKTDFEAFYKLAGQGVEYQVARLAAQPYCLASGVVAEDGEFQVVDGCVRVHAIGCGIMLIQRQVFEALAQVPELYTAHVPDYFKQFGISKGVLQCFDHMKRDDGVTMAEDVSFCARWAKLCGGEIWAVVDELITHTGPATFVGHYLTKLVFDLEVQP